MTAVDFSDLSLIRRGGEQMRAGAGPTSLQPVETVAEWQEKVACLRRLFLLCLGEKPALEFAPAPVINWEKDQGAYILRNMSYNVDADERINAYMLIPKGVPLPAPGVLCLHPTTSLGKEQTIGNDPSEKGQDYAYGRELAEAGYVTFCFDLLSANERCYPGLCDFDTAPFYAEYPRWSVRGKDLHDVEVALQVMQSCPEIIPDRLGCIGHSQGGGITMHAMAMDERIKVGVSSAGDCPARISKNPYNYARDSWWVGMPALRDFCTTGKEFPVQMHEFLAMSAPRAVLNFTALNDYQYTLAEAPFMDAAFSAVRSEVSRIFALYQRPEAFVLHTHTKGHGFEKPERELALKFIRRFL